MVLRKRRIIILALGALLAILVYQDWSESAARKNEPFKMESTGQNGLNRLTLTEKATQRLDLKTDKVKKEQLQPTAQLDNGANKTELIVPYSSIIYDADGNAWVYLNPEPQVFVRQKVVIDRIDGDKVILLEGPPAGTEIVTVGLAELWGAEKGIGK